MTPSGSQKGPHMSGRTLLAVILIVIGALALAYQGITYTTHEKVVDVGPIEATKEEHHTVPLPPLLGAVALIGGIAVLVTGRRGD